MFSATFPPEIQRWADEWLREQNVMVSNRKPASANNKVVQNFLNVPERDKKEKVLQLLNKELENMKMSSRKCYKFLTFILHSSFWCVCNIC